MLLLCGVASLEIGLSLVRRVGCRCAAWVLLTELLNMLCMSAHSRLVVAVPSRRAPYHPKNHGSGALGGVGECSIVVCSLEPPIAQVTLITLVETLSCAGSR